MFLPQAESEMNYLLMTFTCYYFISQLQGALWLVSEIWLTNQSTHCYTVKLICLFVLKSPPLFEPRDIIFILLSLFSRPTL